jgi:type IV secretory pathway TraG/TraD family ATPase VirD4
MDPQRFAALLRNLPRERVQPVQDYLASLTADQLSAIRGLGTRLAIVSESHTGAYLVAQRERSIDLRSALDGEQVVLFSLNSSSYGKLASQLGTLVVQDLVTSVGHRLAQPPAQRATVAIDEFSALGADNVISLLARGREAGVSVLLATQELADLDRAAPGLRDQVLGNTALKLVHRQEVPSSAHTIAQMTGTEKVWDHTYQIGRGVLGDYDTTRGTRRQIERFVVHPNEIRSLRTGEAVVIANGSGIAPRKVAVRPARPEVGGAER